MSATIRFRIRLADVRQQPGWPVGAELTFRAQRSQCEDQRLATTDRAETDPQGITRFKTSRRVLVVEPRRSASLVA